VTSAPTENDPLLRIQEGRCYVTFAYDSARAIDLNKAEARVHEATQRSRLRHKRPAPSYFEYQPAPLRLSQDTEAISIGNFRTGPSVELQFYDFGAVAVTYTVDIAGRFAELLTLAGSGEGAARRVADALDSGAAAERFGRMVRALVEGGTNADVGDTSTLKNPEAIDELRRTIDAWQRRQQLSDAQQMFERHRYFTVQLNPVANDAKHRRVATVTVTNPPVNALNERAN